MAKKESKFKYVRFSLLIMSENSDEANVSITKKVGLPEGVPANVIHAHKAGYGVILFVHEDKLKETPISYYVKEVKDTFINWEKEKFKEIKEKHDKIIKLARKAKTKNHKVRYETKD
jgi:hypothetical protein